MTPRLAGVLAVVFLAAGTARAQSTFVPTSGTQTWNSGANWSPSGVPNGVGVATAFGPTAALTVNLDAGITVGSITATNNTTNIVTIANGTGGPLTFDAVGGGEASLVVNGTSTTTNNVTVSAGVTLNDNLRVTNNNTAGTGAATLTFTGNITGTGGFIKDGPGRLSFTTTAKAYTGPTVVNQGRLRLTGPANLGG